MAVEANSDPMRLSIMILAGVLALAPAAQAGPARSPQERQSLQDLADNGCDVVTMGQYLQPTQKHLPVVRFVHPDEFAFFREEGYKMGLDYVESGPLVRSSYHSERHVHAGEGRKKWESETEGKN